MNSREEVSQSFSTSYTSSHTHTCDVCTGKAKYQLIDKYHQSEAKFYLCAHCLTTHKGNYPSTHYGIRELNPTNKIPSTPIIIEGGI